MLFVLELFDLPSYKSKKTIQKTLEQNHVKKEKKSTTNKLCNRQTKFFEEARFTRSIWNFIIS